MAGMTTRSFELIELRLSGKMQLSPVPSQLTIGNCQYAGVCVRVAEEPSVSAIGVQACSYSGAECSAMASHSSLHDKMFS